MSAHDLEFLSVTTVLLVRHGLTATTGQLLTGWTPGVGLDERGRAQAKALGERLAAVPLDAIITSPLDRCRQTIDEIVAARGGPPRNHGALDHGALDHGALDHGAGQPPEPVVE